MILFLDVYDIQKESAIHLVLNNSSVQPVLQIRGGCIASPVPSAFLSSHSDSSGARYLQLPQDQLEKVDPKEAMIMTRQLLKRQQQRIKKEIIVLLDIRKVLIGLY